MQTTNEAEAVEGRRRRKEGEGKEGGERVRKCTFSK